MSISRAPKHLVPHFCIFQVEERGLEGWEWMNDCWSHRWDTLIEALQKCVAVDGKRGRNVKASLFAGGDAIHITSGVQNLTKPTLKGHVNAKLHYNIEAWERMLWENYLKDHPGLLRWEREAPPLQAGREAQREGARQRLVERLREFLDGAPATSVVLAFTPWKVKGATYDELKMAGLHRRVEGVTHVYLLLGGAHGFDYENDADGKFFQSVLELFADKFGQHRVARVTLCQDGYPLVKFPTASLVSFLNIEYARGMLDHVVAGLQVCGASWVEPAVSQHADWIASPAGAKTCKVGKEEKDACKLKLWSLCGTWWDTKGSKYEIKRDDTKERLVVRVARPDGRASLRKHISLGSVNGQDGLQIVWDGGSYVVDSQLQESSCERPETVEWKAVTRNRRFTWRSTPQEGGSTQR